MAGTLNKLHWKTIKAETKPGKYGDGGGLWCFITETQKSWVFLYSFRGKRCSMGLGSLAAVSLAVAREKAETARQQVAAGIDPKEARDTERPKRGVPTFGEMADDVIKAKAVAWKDGGKQKNEWERTLSRQRDKAGKLRKTGDCLSLIDKRVDQITAQDIADALAPIWGTKQRTAVKLRARVEAIFDAARVAGHRQGENPARWRGNLNALLGDISYETKGHKAMPYRRLPAFMERLRAEPGIPARCLEFIILTAARSGEARGAMWSEIDLEGRCWRVPGARMKMGKPHEVPLGDRAVAILKDLERIRPETGDALIFPSGVGTELHNETVKSVLKRLTDDGSTIHGMRSSFSDWANDTTDYHADVIENALAHRARGARGSYRRATAYDKRVSLMAEWDAYLTGRAAREPATAATGAREPAPGLSVLRAFPVGLRAANAA